MCREFPDNKHNTGMVCHGPGERTVNYDAERDEMMNQSPARFLENKNISPRRDFTVSEGRG